MSLQEDLEHVLSLASMFSKSVSPAMAERDQVMGNVRDSLRELVGELTPALGLTGIDLNVRTGGRQANYSPTPWVRIYSAAFSPSATRGFYIAYLFANDGSAVYLSLNQGTSEWRSGAWRPINNPPELDARAAAARHTLRDFDGTPLAQELLVGIDLASADDDRVGGESRRRTQNYEDANIFARRYTRNEVPNDESLAQDLSDLLPLLAVLYGTPLAFESPEHATNRRAEGAAQRTRSRGAGRAQEYELNRAIELYAEDAAEAILETEWKVRKVGKDRLGYDLECTGPNGVLHVEVKGTRSLGQEVTLTRGEVNHLPIHGGHCEELHALFVLSEIRVVREPSIRCEGGRPRLLFPWAPEATALTPTEYAYRLP